MVGEVEPAPVGVESQRWARYLVGPLDSLGDEVDVGPQPFDVAQVEQHEEDVVVARHQMRAGRELGEEPAAVVLGDAVAAAVERAPTA